MINANAPVVVVELGRNPLAATSNLEVAVATIALAGNGQGGNGEQNVQADWTQANTSADDFIKHKPSLATLPTIDEKAALGASASPSASNPFVTKSELATKIYAPSSIAVPEGSLTSGSVTSLATSGDGLLLIATESVSTGLAVEINFTSITNFNSVTIRSQYSGGANHTWHFELYNYLLTAWEILSEDIGAEPALTWHTLPIANSAPYLSGGNVKLKFHHAPPYINNHTWTCDYAALVQSNAGAVEFPADKIKLAPDPLIGMLETNLQDSTEYLYANKQDKMGEDDNYVTDLEKVAIHSHTNAADLAAVSGTNTGDQDLSVKQDKLETEYPEVPRLVYLVWGGSLAGDGAAPNATVQASIDHLLNVANIPADNIAWLYREEAPSTTILVNGLKGSGRLGTSAFTFASGSISIVKLTGSGIIGASTITVQGGAQAISISKLAGSGAIGTSGITFASGTILVANTTGSGSIGTSAVTASGGGDPTPLFTETFAVWPKPDESIWDLSAASPSRGKVTYNSTSWAWMLAADAKWIQAISVDQFVKCKLSHAGAGTEYTGTLNYLLFLREPNLVNSFASNYRLNISHADDEGTYNTWANISRAGAGGNLVANYETGSNEYLPGVPYQIEFGVEDIGGTATGYFKYKMSAEDPWVLHTTFTDTVPLTGTKAGFGPTASGSHGYAEMEIGEL